MWGQGLPAWPPSFRSARSFTPVPGRAAILSPVVVTDRVISGATAPPVIFALNKIDALAAKHEMLPLLEEYRKRYDFETHLPDLGRNRRRHQ